MMFKQMRRIKQQLSEKECIDILQRQKVGTLALAENGDYPYALPLNYVYYNGKIYFHCAITGHKIDIIKNKIKLHFVLLIKIQLCQKNTPLFIEV